MAIKCFWISYSIEDFIAKYVYINFISILYKLDIKSSLLPYSLYPQDFAP